MGMDYLYSDHGGRIYLGGCDVILQVVFSEKNGAFDILYKWRQALVDRFYYSCSCSTFNQFTLES